MTFFSGRKFLHIIYIIKGNTLKQNCIFISWCVIRQQSNSFSRILKAFPGKKTNFLSKGVVSGTGNPGGCSKIDFKLVDIRGVRENCRIKLRISIGVQEKNSLDIKGGVSFFTWIFGGGNSQQIGIFNGAIRLFSEKAHF